MNSNLLYLKKYCSNFEKNERWWKSWCRVNFVCEWPKFEERDVIKHLMLMLLVIKWHSAPSYVKFWTLKTIFLYIPSLYPPHTHINSDKINIWVDQGDTTYFYKSNAIRNSQFYNVGGQKEPKNVLGNQILMKIYNFLILIFLFIYVVK